VRRRVRPGVERVSVVPHGPKTVMARSPDGRHTAEFVFEDEIRFGPPYYRLRVDGNELPSRTFGGSLCWSDDSTMVATQEWLTIDYERGPMTRVALFDVDRRRWAALRTADKAFVEDFVFDGGTFVYRKHFRATGRIEEVEVDLTAIRDWKPY
jgi:hypothetical protein